MIPADIDPSLWSGAPTPDRLDDGFSPPPPHAPAGQPDEAGGPAPARPEPPPKSLF